MRILYAILFIVLIGCEPSIRLSIPSKVPAQFVFAGADCNALVPDYTTKLVPSDNCKLSWFVQDPAPGLLLTPENMSMIVTLRAGDASGNVAEVSFSVTLVDTIKPVFNIDPSFLLSSWEVIDKLYDHGDRALKQMVFHDEILNADTEYLPRQVGNSYFAGIDRRVYSDTDDGVLQVDSAFLGKTLVIRVPPDNKRTFTFE